MADEEKGAKWWFRYVIVPMIGGGGAIAIITAYIQKTSEPTQTHGSAAQLQTQPAQSAPQHAARTYTFQIYYLGEGHKFSAAEDSTQFFTSINVYIDDLLAGTLETDEDRAGGETTVSKLGKHRYNIGGYIIKRVPGGQESKTMIEGEGTIYVQEGCEFQLVVDRTVSHGPNRETMRLERVK
jgi:hypothetical protein